MEPATFRLVAQRLNQLRYRVPPFRLRALLLCCDCILVGYWFLMNYEVYTLGIVHRITLLLAM